MIRKIRTQLTFKIVDGIVVQKFVQEEGTAIVEAANAKVDTQDDAVKSMLYHCVVETMIKFVLVGKQISIVQFCVTKYNFYKHFENSFNIFLYRKWKMCR